MARPGRRRWSIRVVTIGGVDVRVHAGMLLLVWLVLLASTEEAGDSLAATLWLGLLFASVLVHEMAHSLVAVRRGVRVTEIELLPIGGVSKMDRIPDRPTVELAIAAAGPLTSMALGIASLGCAMATGAGVWPPDLYGGAWLQRLGWLNLLLAGFNLLPALPLDGGRIFRALVEGELGPSRATHVAARIGRYFAVTMMAVGALANLWLVVIGVFVYLASEGEEAGSVIHERLGGVHAADVMIRDPEVVTPQTPVEHVTNRLSRTAQRQFPVVDHGVYIGMVDADQLAAPAAVVAEVVEPVPSVAPETSLDELAVLDTRAAAVAVVANGAVVGLVTLGDIHRLVAQALRHSQEQGAGR